MKILNKKVMSILMAFTMIVVFIVPANAQSNIENKPVVIRDDNEVRIAKGTENGYDFIATFNKKENTIELVKKELNKDKVLENKTFDLNSTNNNQIVDDENQIIMPMARSIKQNTFSNYEYTKWYGSPNKWELRRPADSFGIINRKYFQTYENSRNSTYISSFYNAVENIDRLEKEYMTYVSLEILTGTLGAIFTGGLGTFLAAAGLGAQAVNIAWKINSECRTAEDNYWEVFYKQ